jgi:hypothetical protein
MLANNINSLISIIKNKEYNNNIKKLIYKIRKTYYNITINSIISLFIKKNRLSSLYKPLFI